MPWRQLLLVSLAPMVAMVVFVNVAPLLPLIRDDLALSNAIAGSLGAATILTHTALQLPAGYIAERIGVKRAIVIGMAIVAAGTIASAAAPNVGLLLASRLVTGIGVGISFITSLAFVNVVAPPARRQLAQGMFGAAANAGVLLVMVLSGRLLLLGGWRECLFIEGLVILAIAVLIAACLRSDVSFSKASSASWGETLRHRHLYILGFAHVVTYGAFTGISSWAVTFLADRYNFGLEWAGILSASLPATSIAARIFGGGISTGRERKSVFFCTLVTAVGIGLLPLLPNAALSVLDLAAVGWFAAMPFGAVFSYASLVTGERASGRDLSLMNFVGNFGALLFPPAIGYALDLCGSFAFGFGIVMVTGVAVSVAIAAWLPRPRYGATVPVGEQVSA